MSHTHRCQDPACRAALRCDNLDCEHPPETEDEEIQRLRASYCDDWCESHNEIPPAGHFLVGTHPFRVTWSAVHDQLCKRNLAGDTVSHDAYCNQMRRDLNDQRHEDIDRVRRRAKMVQGRICSRACAGGHCCGWIRKRISAAFLAVEKGMEVSA